MVGEDVFLGYAPERVDPGNGKFTIKTTPKLVAGVTEECRRRTPAPVLPDRGRGRPGLEPDVAETAKLHENTFRAVNIALANELALICDKLGISPWEVIEAASSKPFAFLPHYPGPGLGGDCIPVVPQFLAARVREYGYSPRLIDAAHEINTEHAGLRRRQGRGRAERGGQAGEGLTAPAPRHGVQGERPRHARVAEPRGHAPPARARRRRRHVRPVGRRDRARRRDHTSVEWTRAEVERADCVVLLTDHRLFMDDRCGTRRAASSTPAMSSRPGRTSTRSRYTPACVLGSPDPAHSA